MTAFEWRKILKIYTQQESYAAVLAMNLKRLQVQVIA